MSSQNNDQKTSNGKNPVTTTSIEAKTTHKYAVLMETSGEECESWYYCIQWEKNKENLQHLQDQLESVDWYILDDLSTFDLDLEHLISEQTAKELTKLELNHHSFHRKFDGSLDKINLHLRSKDKNEKKMVKVFDVLGYGQIEDFVDKEDLDEEDLSSSTEDEEDDVMAPLQTGLAWQGESAHFASVEQFWAGMGLLVSTYRLTLGRLRRSCAIRRSIRRPRPCCRTSGRTRF